MARLTTTETLKTSGGFSTSPALSASLWLLGLLLRWASTFLLLLLLLWLVVLLLLLPLLLLLLLLWRSILGLILVIFVHKEAPTSTSATASLVSVTPREQGIRGSGFLMVAF